MGISQRHGLEDQYRKVFPLFNLFNPKMFKGGQQQINPNLFGMAAGGQPFPAIQGMSLNTGLAGLVNQAAFTNMNMGGMNMNSMLAQAQRQQQMIPPQQQQIQQPRQQPQQQATSPTRSQRTFIGLF